MDVSIPYECLDLVELSLETVDLLSLLLNLSVMMVCLCSQLVLFQVTCSRQVVHLVHQRQEPCNLPSLPHRHQEPVLTLHRLQWINVNTITLNNHSHAHQPCLEGCTPITNLASENVNHFFLGTLLQQRKLCVHVYILIILYVTGTCIFHSFFIFRHVSSHESWLIHQVFMCF